MIYFISDTHWNHFSKLKGIGIIQYTDRPFQSVEEMDETLIYNWNKVVKKGDTVYHLGDFCFGKINVFESYIKRLNGQINILANWNHHDKLWLKDFKGATLTATGEICQLEESIVELNYNKVLFVLCHFPFAVWNKKHYLSFHLYGHTHRNIIDDHLSMSVSVENINYTPISFGQVLNVYNWRIKEYNLKPIGEFI